MRRLLPFFLAFALASCSLAADPLPRKGTFGAQLSPAEGGVRVVRVFPGSTADGAGLKEGDVIQSINGQPVKNPGELSTALATTAVGSDFELAYRRGDKENRQKAKFRERPRAKGQNFTMLYDSVVGANGKRMRTLITKPNAPGKHPVMLIIGGIGSYSMDTPVGVGPYNEFVKEFGENNWVVARVDKPGQGDSEGGPTTETDFDTELENYRQLSKAVRALDFVDTERIYLFGHSMGGAFGPILASEQPFKGVAVYGTMFKTWVEYMLENNRRQALLSGSPEPEVFSYLIQMGRLAPLLFSTDKSLETIKTENPDLAPLVSGLMPDGKLFSGRVLPFWRQLTSRNLPEYWTKHKRFVGAFWGSSEFVSTREDHVMIARIAGDRGTFVEVPESDHGFIRTTSTQDALRKMTSGGGVFNYAIVDELKKWIAACEGSDRLVSWKTPVAG